MNLATDIRFPRNDYSRIPYAVYHDAALYALEQERIFRGRTWSYLCLAAEIPKAGDFKTTWVGDTPVVVNREDDGSVHAFVNRCAHRGAVVRREPRGNAADHTCIYHRWCYSRQGDLLGIPFQRGVRGKGGMPASFDKKDHGLTRLRVARHGGLVFASYSPEAPPIADYLGPHACAQIERLLVQRKPRVLGYLRQRIPGNWKLYNENVRDPYHGSLLHQFQVSFGLQQPTMRGGIKLDRDRKNTWNHSILSADDAANQKHVAAAYEGTGKYDPNLKMADARLIQVPLDLDDGYKTTILSIFPTLVVAQVDNTYAIRHLRPKGPDLVELHLTYLGFETDTPEQTHDKLLTVNMVGPAGYISLEDGEALRLVQEGIRARRPGGQEVLEMGGIGPIQDTDYLSQEISIRGFWSFYHRVMGFGMAADAEGAR